MDRRISAESLAHPNHRRFQGRLTTSADGHSDTRAAKLGPAAQAPRARGSWWIRGLLAASVVAALATAAVFTRGSASGQPASAKLTHTVSRGELIVSVTEQGTLESSNNTEVKCKVRGFSVVTWVVPAGTVVEPGAELVRLDTKVTRPAEISSSSS